MRDKVPARQPGSHALFLGVGSDDAYAAWQRSLRICDGDTPGQVLQAVIEWFCDGPEWWVTAGPYPGLWGQARVYRIRPARSLLVLGETPMAIELRQLLEAGAAPGWSLHSVPDRHIALGDLAESLREASGRWLAHNLLARAGFQYAEEIAALPEDGLQDLPQCGPKCLTAIRQVLSDFGFDTGSDAAGQVGQHESGDSIGPAPVSAVFIDSLQALAEWAARERAATSVGDIVQLAFERTDLPPDVAECWDHVREHSLQSLSGPVLTDDDLVRLASQLLAEVDERRSLILTSRSFASQPRTVSSLATQLRVTEQRVRQIEASALHQLARASANSRYAALRWGSATITHSNAPNPGADASMPAWIPGMLTWLARWPEVTPTKRTLGTD